MNFKEWIVNQYIKHELSVYKKTKQYKLQSLKDKVAQKFDIDYKTASILVNTENAKKQTKDTLLRYKQYEITHYEFFADTDEQTCDKCAALDGKKIKIINAKIGVNAPPMHNGCRCCILPVVDE